MKKVIVTLLSITLTLVFAATTAFATSEDITIKHQIDPLSDFSVKAKNITKFESTSAKEVATVKIKNNTRDGYQITMVCKYGQLTPSGTTNGEQAIDYNITKTGGDGTPSSAGFTVLTMPDDNPISVAEGGDGPVLILGADAALEGAQLLSEPTDTEFTLKVAITDGGFLDMAGNYSDEITLVYTDN